MRRLGLAALLIAEVLYAPARADQAPASPPAETCTIEKQQHAGEECLMCSAWRGDAAKCQKRLAGRGYERRCRGEGDSVWSEAWCRPAAGKAQAAPAHGASPKQGGE